MPVTKETSKNNLKRLREVLSNLLKGVELLGGTNSKGLITTKDIYQAARAEDTFGRLNTLIGAYDPSID